jgi:uncharacterized protein YjbJ (UPF0337 family)
MVNQQVLAGKWNEVKGRIKQKWGALSDEDIRSFNGNVDQLVGRIQRKTGETRDVIEEFLTEVTEAGERTTSKYAERMQDSAEGMAAAAQQGYESLRQGYAEAERTVQEHPGQSVAIAFGVGVLAGVAVTLLLRDRPKSSGWEQSTAAAERFGRQMLNALADLMPTSLR